MHARIQLTVILVLAALFGLTLACTTPEPEQPVPAPETESVAALPSASGLPPKAETALATLESSPRHGEWVDIELPGSDVPIATWVVYPERSDNAPLVLVIHEIFGLTDWIRAVADQLAADGFIALAPDLLSGHGPDGGATDSIGGRDEVIAAIRALDPVDRTERLNAVRTYALSIPAGNGRLGTVGYCWGGGASFDYAVSQADLDAAVVYYGTSPEDTSDYEQINAPVLGLYAGDDQRVNATVPTAEEAMTAHSKQYEPVFYEGAGHGFLRAQADREGANMRATEQAWPRTIEFFREHLES